jgi:hypothetical protein
VIFKGKKSTIFAIILRPFEKWKNYQDILPESNGCSIVLKTRKQWLLRCLDNFSIFQTASK